MLDPDPDEINADPQPCLYLIPYLNSTVGSGMILNVGLEIGSGIYSTALSQKMWTEKNTFEIINFNYIYSKPLSQNPMQNRARH